MEMFDWNTRITQTNYALGWPAKQVPLWSHYHNDTQRSQQHTFQSMRCCDNFKNIPWCDNPH